MAHVADSDQSGEITELNSTPRLQKVFVPAICKLTFNYSVLQLAIIEKQELYQAAML